MTDHPYADFVHFPGKAPRFCRVYFFACSGADSPAAGQQPTAGNAFDLLTKLLGESDERSGILADFADRAHAAGLACERDYDSAREAVSAR